MRPILCTLQVTEQRWWATVHRGRCSRCTRGYALLMEARGCLRPQRREQARVAPARGGGGGGAGVTPGGTHLPPWLSTSCRTRLLPWRTTWRPRARPPTLRRGTRGLSRRRTVLLSRLPTCEVPQAFLRFRFLTDAHWFVLWEEGK